MHFAACFKAAGLKSKVQVDLQAQWQEYNEENSQQISRYLLRMARMHRNETKYKELMGEDAYSVHFANYTWHVFLMMGKLSLNAYQLTKE
jgi:hypothetical protein